mgnify:CR=1 FL=1
MGDKIFLKQRITNWWALFWLFFIAGLFGIFSYSFGNFYWDNKEINDAIDSMILVLMDHKSQIEKTGSLHPTENNDDEGDEANNLVSTI